MEKRTAHTKKIRINSLSYSSIFDIGDVQQCAPRTQAIAVQKQGGVESDEGFEVENFALFERQPSILPNLTPINHRTNHHSKHIHVDTVDITGVSTSSVVQIGSLNQIDSEARIKHIRILEEEQNEDNEI